MLFGTFLAMQVGFHFAHINHSLGRVLIWSSFEACELVFDTHFLDLSRHLKGRFEGTLPLVTDFLKIISEKSFLSSLYTPKLILAEVPWPSSGGHALVETGTKALERLVRQRLGNMLVCGVWGVMKVKIYQCWHYTKIKPHFPQQFPFMLLKIVLFRLLYIFSSGHEVLHFVFVFETFCRKPPCCSFRDKNYRHSAATTSNLGSVFLTNFPNVFRQRFVSNLTS